MRDSKKVLEIAKYILKEERTLEEVAKYFNLSKRTIQLYVKELDNIDHEIYLKVNEIKKQNESKGKRKGGKVSKATHKITIDEIEEIARVMVNEDLTIKEASIRYNIKESTLYDNLMRIEQEKLKNNIDLLFENHKKNK